MVKRELELLRLRLIEFHVVHHCNLNCEGCSHFAPSAPKSIVLSSEIEKQVILASKKLAPEFVHILGGEPLLHPELEMLLPIFFKAFPSAKLKLVTNGILLNKKINKLLPSLKENNVVLSISIYKNTILDKDLLINKLNTLGVEYELWQQDTFIDFLDPFGKSDPIEARKNCSMEGYFNIRDDRLFPCPVSAWSDFGGAKLSLQDGVSLNANIKDLKTLLDGDRITSKCRFCRTSPRRVDHSIGTYIPAFIKGVKGISNGN
jgi:hypothetical protein